MNSLSESVYKAVAIGASTGGLDALKIILSALPEDFTAPIFVAQHISPNSDNFMACYLDGLSSVRVKEADEKEVAENGTVYIAPANYHLLVEDNHTLSLSVEERVNYSRPSVDVLFESAADAYGPHLVGVILTGANRDGSRGLRRIHETGGLTIVQSPETAAADEMPRASLSLVTADHILPLDKIGVFLYNLFMGYA